MKHTFHDEFVIVGPNRERPPEPRMRYLWMELKTFSPTWLSTRKKPLTDDDASRERMLAQENARVDDVSHDEPTTPQPLVARTTHSTVFRYLTHGSLLRALLLRILRHCPPAWRVNLAVGIDAYFAGQQTALYRLWPLVASSIIAVDSYTYYRYPDERIGIKAADILSGFTDPINNAFITSYGLRDPRIAVVLAVTPFILGVVYAVLLPSYRRAPGQDETTRYAVPQARALLRYQQQLRTLIWQPQASATLVTWAEHFSTQVTAVWQRLWLLSPVIQAWDRLGNEVNMYPADLSTAQALQQVRQSLAQWLLPQITWHTRDNIFSYIYAHYQLWVNGIALSTQPDEAEQALLTLSVRATPFKPQPRALSVCFSLLWLSSWYFVYRYWQVLATTLIQYGQQRHAQHACEATQGVWQWDAQRGDDTCLVCDWPEVYVLHQLSVAGCLADTLKAVTEPSILLERIRWLSARYPRSIISLDLQPTAWHTWSDHTWVTFTEALMTLSQPPLQTLILTRTPPLSQPLRSVHYTQIGRFIAATQPASLYLAGVLWPHETTVLEHVPAIMAAAPHTLDLSAMQLTDTGLLWLLTQTTWLHNATQLLLADNPLTAMSLQVFMTQRAGTHVEQLDLSGLACTQACLEVLANANVTITHVSLNRWPLTAMNLWFLHIFLQQAAIHVISLQTTGLTDPKVRQLFATSIPGTLHTLDLADNPGITAASLSILLNTRTAIPLAIQLAGATLTAGGPVLAQWLPSSAITELDISRCGITDDDWLAFCQSLPPALQILRLAGNDLTALSMRACAHTLAAHAFDTLDLSDNPWQSQGLAPLLQAYQAQPNALRALNVANTQLDNTLASQWAATLRVNPSWHILDISNNPMGDSLPALLAVLPEHTLSVLRANRMAIEQPETVLSTLTAVLPHSQLTELSLQDNNLHAPQAVIGFAAALAAPLVQPERLGLRTVNPALSRQWAAAQPATPLTQLYLQAAHLPTAGVRAVCRVLPDTLIQWDPRMLADNDVSAIDPHSCAVISEASTAFAPTRTLSALLGLWLLGLLLQHIIMRITDTVHMSRRWWHTPGAFFASRGASPVTSVPEPVFPITLNKNQ